MRRIGLLGGTFNPVHKGHIYIAKEALSQLDLDEVWLLPAGAPPHKEAGLCAARTDRLAMCRLACEDEPGLVVSEEEIFSAETNYTERTLDRLVHRYPDTKFYFIIGQDSLEQFSTWKNPEKISSLAAIAAANRTDQATESAEKTAQKLRGQFPGEFVILRTDNIPVSSTEIRNCFYDHADTRYEQPMSDMIPRAEFDYIQRHRLYQKPWNPRQDIKTIKDKLQTVLKPKRYAHVINVMNTCANLAMRYNYPMEEAVYAGLLHDCAKYMSDQQLLVYCREHEISVTAEEKAAPYLLHAKAGAYMAKEVYGIDCPRIQEAIRLHTTGDAKMTLLSEILFVADYIEPARNEAKNLTDIRSISYLDLDLAIAVISENTLDYLKEKGAAVDSKTRRTYEYYRKKVKEKREHQGES